MTFTRVRDRKELVRVPDRGILVGAVDQLHRYPGKSMLGGRVDALALGDVIEGDHEIAVVNKAGDVVTAKQAVGARLLTVTAYALPSPVGCRPRYRLRVPDAMCSVAEGDYGGYKEGDYNDPFIWAELKRLLGISVRVVWIGDEPRPHRRIDRKPVRPNTFVDVADVHLVTTASVEYVEAQAFSDHLVRRMRPQLVVRTEDWLTALAELGWVGRWLRIGEEVVLRIDEPTKRCAMPGRAQPGLAADPGLLRWLHEHLYDRFGVSASIERPGRIKLGDKIYLV